MVWAAWGCVSIVPPPLQRTSAWFCPSKRSCIPMHPSTDVPPSYLAKDGFAGLWSSLCNAKAASWCITLIHLVAASGLALTPRQIPFFPNKHNIVIVMY